MMEILLTLITLLLAVILFSVWLVGAAVKDLHEDIKKIRFTLDV